MSKQAKSAKRPRSKRATTERRYRVYVIELSDPRPRRNPDLPWVYVGFSSKTPRERFLVHKAGGRIAAPRVTRYGVRLRHDLYSHLAAFRVQEDAIRAERALRRELLDKGYSVEGGKPGFFDAHVSADSSEPAPKRGKRSRRASFPGPSRTIIVEPITTPDKEPEPVEVPSEEPDREPAEVPA